MTDKPVVVISMGQTLNPDRIKSGDDVYFECSIDAKPRAHKIAWLFNVSFIILRKFVLLCYNI